LRFVSGQAARLSASFGAFLSDKEKHAIIGAKSAVNVSPQAFPCDTGKSAPRD